ncbi:aminoglycoside phosphotransferase family protein [Nonomuraea candida]|uniref:aminoglycoside phosphotransferase family protein n=1 Tax=Nonomuraea candida TaxID=359159 RepID=UPI0005B8EB3C|nr:aminoglycoside phosphotransferase family protein [Nonomuraea candida]
MRITVPEALAASHLRHEEDAGPAWTAALPALAGRFLDEWDLRPDGEPRHGIVALVLPVVRADGTRAALKLQPVTEETAGEAVALRAWAGDGSVLLLESDPHTGTMLLERLDGGRSLSAEPDVMRALEILTGLLRRLVRRPAPEGTRGLDEVARRMLDRVDPALARLPRERDRHWVRHCAGAVAELAAEPAPPGGDRLLHWDLHYDNVLAAEREPWLAIDPKPLAGDPGFELLPALWNRWDEVVATGDVARAVLRRFDLMVDGLGLDRRRAAGWTLGRVLQNCLWEAEGGEDELSEVMLAVAEALWVRW